MGLVTTVIQKLVVEMMTTKVESVLIPSMKVGTEVRIRRLGCRAGIKSIQSTFATSRRLDLQIARLCGSNGQPRRVHQIWPHYLVLIMLPNIKHVSVVDLFLDTDSSEEHSVLNVVSLCFNLLRTLHQSRSLILTYDIPLDQQVWCLAAASDFHILFQIQTHGNLVLKAYTHLMAAVYLHNALYARNSPKNENSFVHSRNLSTVSNTTFITSTTVHSQPTEPLLTATTPPRTNYDDRIDRIPRNREETTNPCEDTLVIDDNPIIEAEKGYCASNCSKPLKRWKWLKLALQVSLCELSTFSKHLSSWGFGHRRSLVNHHCCF